MTEPRWPQPGDFALTTISPWPVGTLVRVAEWLNGDGFSPWSHAFVVLDHGEIIEAEPGGARYAPLSAYDHAKVVYSGWDLSDAQRAGIVREARKLIDTPYSIADYFGLAAHRLHIPAPGLRRYIANSGHMICSQLVDEAHRRAGVHLFNDNRWPGDVTPADLESVLKGPA